MSICTFQRSAIRRRIATRLHDIPMRSLIPSKTNRGRHWVVEDDHGSLQIEIRRATGGVYVEREEVPRTGRRIRIGVLLPDKAEFERWCANDPGRFRSPLLYEQVRRAVDLFGSPEPP